MDLQTLSQLTLSQLLAGYQQGNIDPVEVMELTLAQIDKVNSKINAIYDLQVQPSLDAAKAAAQRYKDGQAKPLDGVPVTVKDSMTVAGMSWHHGSAAHGEGITAELDLPPVVNMKNAGAILIGKGTMPDFGLSASGVSSYHGIVRNPWSLAWNTGGSSAGAGASLAAGIGMMSMGSDIAGSVRLPASHCGLAALKPTQGMIAYIPASDVRSAGIMVRHAADLEPLLRLFGGVHQDDRFSVPVIEPAAADYSAATVAVHRKFGFGPSVDAVVLEVLENAASQMTSLVAKVKTGQQAYDFDAYLPIDDSLKIRGWREYQHATPENRDKTPQQLIDWFAEAEHWNSERIAEFESGLAKGIAQSNQLFADTDFILTPVMPIVNFPAGDRGIDEAMPLRHCTFTALFNQSGHPAVSICAGFDGHGLPIGVQIVAKRFDDIRLVRLATALEAKLWPDGAPGRPWPLNLDQS